MNDTVTRVFIIMTLDHVPFERWGKVCMLSNQDIMQRLKTWNVYGVILSQAIYAYREEMVSI